MRLLPASIGVDPRPRTRVNVVAVLACAALVAGQEAPAGHGGADLARRAGLRVLESRHLTLVTDKPAREGDGVAELPRIFDEAVAAWCRHYRFDETRVATWRAFGCLMVDRDRFHDAGLLPTDGSVPDFVNGFCRAERFWMMDQSNPAYRRHLLLHEGVHAFTLTLRHAAAPTWYTEGIAEYLATHRLEAAADGEPRFVPTPLPDRATDVAQLGRIEKIRSLRRLRAAPGLVDILAMPPSDHRDIAAYAASWAAVACLARHPAHAAAFSACEFGPLDSEFNARLAASPGWDAVRAARDFDAFTDEVDYGYDFGRSAIDWAPGRKATARERFLVDAGRGWQNSGVALVAGGTSILTASGTVRIGEVPATTDAAAIPIESAADGISLHWYRGRPAGRLVAAQWMERPPDGGRPRFVVLGDGARQTLTAAVAGPLYLKINESPGALADNRGTLEVVLVTTPGPE